MTEQSAQPAEETIKQIYSGKPQDFHWVGFGSLSGTNLRECAKVIKPKLVFSDRPKAALLQLRELEGIEKIVLNGFQHCGSYKAAEIELKEGKSAAMDRYLEKSKEFNEIILENLKNYENRNGRIDLIVLGGYMRLVIDPLLGEYQDRIINVHPSHLPVNSSGKKPFRKFTGDNAVHDAILAGEPWTRSSTIMVDNQVDHGEILVQGPWLAVPDEYCNEDKTLKKRTQEFSDYHQGIQKRISDWPSLTKALTLISEGRLALGTNKTHFGEWRTVYLDGKALSYEGLQL